MHVQIRHRADGVPARVRRRTEEEVELAFETPQRAVTPGQSAVVFEGDVVLGGGRIDRRVSEPEPVGPIS